MTGDQPVESMSYEQAFQQLEEVVNAMENEQHPLEQVLALYERGQKLAQRCAVLLEQAELKVRQLAGDDLIPLEASS